MDRPRTALRFVQFALILLVVSGAGCSRATATNAGAGAASGAAGPDTVDPPGTYMGRTLAQPMSYQGADWLDREDRETTEQPEHVLDVIQVHDGQTVADVGCGSGYFTVRIAKRVG